MGIDPHFPHSSFTGHSKERVKAQKIHSCHTYRNALQLSPLHNQPSQHFGLLHTTLRGRNSSVGSAWARCPQSQVRSSSGDIFGRGDFSLGVNMGSNSIPPKTASDESINRGLVCAYMHFIARTQKILTFMSKTGECQQQKHTQHAPSTKTECDYLNGWI